MGGYVIVRTIDEICQSCADSKLHEYLQQVELDLQPTLCDDCGAEVEEGESRIINGDRYCPVCASLFEEL